MSATFERVGVIGGGLMGSGIAEVCARAGCSTIVIEADAGSAERALQRIRQSLDRATTAGKLSEADRDRAFHSLTVTHDFHALHDRQLVVEAIVENESAKVDVFRRLDDVVSAPDAVLASNTSSIPIMKLAMATQRPSQVVGIHFFNPVPVLKLVELVTSLLTSQDTSLAAERFAAEKLGKRVIRSKDRAGFIVNALLIPYCAHPMGPLRLCDLIGLDTTMAVAESLYAEFKEQLYAPPPLLCRMVEAGLLGRKTGRGFYNYNK
jgi:3-hydroxybutyryl-CoA dehydrogenase